MTFSLVSLNCILALINDCAVLIAPPFNLDSVYRYPVGYSIVIDDKKNPAQERRGIKNGSGYVNSRKRLRLAATIRSGNQNSNLVRRGNLYIQ